MKIRVVLLIILLLMCYTFEMYSQSMPLVYDVESTGKDCPVPYLPTMAELPVVQSLPDPFEWADGRGRIKYFSDWECRRAEIKAEIENYEIGIKPDRPDSITANYSDGVLTVNVTVNGQTLTLTSQVYLPTGSGPFPAVIGMNSPSGSIPSSIFTSRNIARIVYNHNQVTSYGNPKNTDPYYKLYPNLNVDNTGQYSAWAWGVSRIIDGLELVQNTLPIDLKHIAVTGCSYAGKLALFAGALDERVALTISQESGGGGYTTWRYSEVINQSVSVETLGKTDYNWFKNSMQNFSSSVNKLPEDHHELMAMVAPRALLVTGNPDFVWLADESGYVGSNAAKKVWQALGVPDRFGYSIVGGHNHCVVPESQMPQIEAFVDKFLLGNVNVNTNIATAPYSTNLSPWITWTVPALVNGSSFFGKTTLVSPSTQQKDMETNITFKWNKAKDAAKYIIQLSTSLTFSNIVKSDSTISDTSITFTNLGDGILYYWRVQIKNVDGLPGPWSDVWNFSTYIDAPEKPQLIGFSTHESRPDYIYLKWYKVKNANQYLVQLADVQTFTYGVASATVTDTFKLFDRINEGVKYYWRVQAANVGGTSPWSDVSNFTLIIAPSELVVKKSAEREVTLTWKDNSAVEDGYIVERKQDSQTEFEIIDTVDAGVNTYIDKNLEANINYTYRVKAYTNLGESNYCSEVSIILTGIQKEDVPTEYSLGQNYPNPFNPTTKISYQLPQTAHVSLNVFDIMGRQVSVLVNEKKSPGTYGVLFNGSKLTSGIYFYQLVAGSFIKTKKFILLK